MHPAWVARARREEDARRAAMPAAHVPAAGETVALVHGPADRDGNTPFTLLWWGWNQNTQREGILAQCFRAPLSRIHHTRQVDAPEA